MLFKKTCSLEYKKLNLKVFYMFSYDLKLWNFLKTTQNLAKSMHLKKFIFLYIWF
jgi:hypothetical protein